jgi:hypothetical protein
MSARDTFPPSFVRSRSTSSMRWARKPFAKNAP